MEYSVDIVGRQHLTNIFASMPAIVQLAMRERAEGYAAEASRLAAQLILQRAQNGTGKWASTVTGEAVETELGKIAVVIHLDGVPYGRIQDKGGLTRPHIILPRVAKMLAFTAASGEKVITKRVKHPGSRIPAMNISRDVRREMAAKMSRGFKKAIVDGIRQNMRTGRA